MLPRQKPALQTEPAVAQAPMPEHRAAWQTPHFFAMLREVMPTPRQWRHKPSISIALTIAFFRIVFKIAVLTARLLMVLIPSMMIAFTMLVM
jgi:hypothetical protein